MLPERVDAILIDFYGTISAGDRAAVSAVCRNVVEAYDLSLDPNAFAIAWGELFFGIVERSNHNSFKTLYECELASLQEILANDGDNPDPAQFLIALEEYWADPPIHADAVEFLKSVDVPICCVSNADTRPLLAAIEKHNLRFDAVISSQAARCYKPQADIFLQALDALAVSADRVVHIGDSLHSDIGGAAKLGIKTVWVCREERIHDIGTGEPDLTVNLLTELPRSLWPRGSRG